MTLSLDPQVAAAMAPVAAAMADTAPPPVGDVGNCRALLNGMMAQTAGLQPMPSDVKATDFHVATADKTDVLLRWYKTYAYQADVSIRAMADRHRILSAL